MSEKKSVDIILEACRSNGPIDESIVRGINSTEKNDSEYYGDDIRGIKYLQFSEGKLKK